MLKRYALCLACLGPLACGQPAPSKPATPPPSDARVRQLADAYLAAYFERFPESVTQYGIAGHRQNKLFDNSLAALRAWQQREDAWLADVRQIDPSTIADPPLRATYAIVREALEGSIATRVCRSELWTVSQFVNAWQVQEGYIVTIQPVGTDAARQDALARFGSLPEFVDTEIANLRDGIKQGYTAPKGIVRIVIDQMKTLTSGPVADSPFDSPAVRDKTPAFAQQYDALVKDRINPAFVKYREFLEREYLPAAREAIGVSAIPNGAACYDASVRYHSSLPMSAAAVHAAGLKQIDAIGAEMQTIAERSFHTRDVPKLLQQVRTDPKYTFKSREALIAYSQAALARAKAAVPQRFGLLPKADVVIQPYPKFREKNGPNEYNAPAEDGSRPGIFFINAYQPDKHSRVEDESTAFHETIPGHHLQGSIALERKGIHPIGRYISNSGYAEGWALYAERLADEMNLFSSDLDRLGMLSSQSLRAARLVVDSGIHTMGWTRQQAIDYMLAHTAESEHDSSSEVDRYVIYPGQATAYMLGMLQIRQARDDAEKTMGTKFDIKAFHDRVLEDGGVPLTFLTAKVKHWAEAAR
ncbi:MAG TPA: DUF885 domain-containing protein [Vicinamibacterales bacterium]|jgi:uncharacterized protein (DUF885 family)|nr:DUF885 domain-containing protein [Vicinamibacterales bacterium]